ncbi:MAG: CRTAC1 family protein [Chloroflexota bacterium]|nr:CRTAC1 family protein [Chloroflexota bacterium]
MVLEKRGAEGTETFYIRQMKSLVRLAILILCISFLTAVGKLEPFADVSESAGISATHSGDWQLFDKDFITGYLGIGQAWGDYDRDGWLDLYVTGNRDPSVLYRNNGDGTFSRSDLSPQVALADAETGGAVWADYDNDGWLDLYVLNHGANTLFHNDGGRGFTDVTERAGAGDAGKGTTAAWGDYDGDSFLDLYVVNWSCFPECGDPNITREHDEARDTLYHNRGDGSFEDVTHLLDYDLLLGAGFSASFTDYDNDGDPDIYVVNDQFKNMLGNILWRNDGPGCGGWCWREVSIEAGARTFIHGMGLAVGDYDNDLDLDFYFSDMVNGMVLLQNQGDGSFDDVAEEAGVVVGPSSAVGWGTIFFDYNNDAWLDLILTATEFIQFDIESGPEGMMFEYRDFLFKNRGDGSFADVTPEDWLVDLKPSMGLAYADYDRDGFLDFVMGNWNEGYVLYRNTGADGGANNWINIRLIGDGDINRDAIGARVYIRTDDGRTLLQEVKSGSSLGAGNDTALHFGLGDAGIRELLIRWPNGVEETLRDVAVNQFLEVAYTR